MLLFMPTMTSTGEQHETHQFVSGCRSSSAAAAATCCRCAADAAPTGLPSAQLLLLPTCWQPTFGPPGWHVCCRGVVCLVEVKDGRVQKGDKITAASTGVHCAHGWAVCLAGRGALRICAAFARCLIWLAVEAHQRCSTPGERAAAGLTGVTLSSHLQAPTMR